MSLYLGLLGLYLYRVQCGYVQSWAVQKDFWNQVFRLCPELQAGVTVIVAGPLAPPSPFVQSNSSQDFRLIRTVFDRKSGLFEKKRLRKVSAAVLALRATGRPYRFQDEAGTLKWMAQAWEARLGWTSIDENNLILLRSDDGKLSRVAQLADPLLPRPLVTKVTLGRNASLLHPARLGPLYHVLCEGRQP